MPQSLAQRWKNRGKAPQGASPLNHKILKVRYKMTIYKTQAEIIKMRNTIVDFATMMTQLDVWEASLNPYDEVVII